PGFGPGPSFSNGPGFNRGPGFSANPGFHGGHNHRSGFGNVPPAIWHDTSHYDWIPGQWVRHGHHVHWVPGRWVPHQTGHIDTLHGNHVHHHAH
ncbi:MAG: hypothetical protein KF861_16715, partial [Planctomycetaceae bacterium]|nr:hypothetical protein [Planctomycetaceae bacterium]